MKWLIRAIADLVYPPEPGAPPEPFRRKLLDCGIIAAILLAAWVLSH